MKKIYLIMLPWGLLSIILMRSSIVQAGEILVDALVGNQQMAKDLAYIYIKNIYGENNAGNQKPYKVTDNLNGWKVEGKPPSTQGGNFTIIIAKKDGQVTELTHTK